MFRGFFSLLIEAFKSFGQDKAARLSAALSYYTLFSIPPLLILLIGVAGLVFGHDAVRESIIHSLRQLVGQDGAAAVREMLKPAEGARHGMPATLLGIGTL